MKISNWLDEKEAENADMSQLTLPTEMVFDEDTDEFVFFEEVIPAVFSVQKITPLQRSNVSDTGISAEARTGRRAFIPQE